MKKITVIIPFFNGLETIEEVVRRSLSTCIIHGFDGAVMVVDDSGNDEKAVALKRIFQREDKVTVLHLSHNLGQHAATFIGILNAGETDIVTIDEDLKFPPELIPEMMDKLPENGVVYGFVEREGFTELLKDFVLGVIKPLISNVYPIHTSSFRIVSAQLASRMRKMRPNYIQLEGVIIQSKCRFTYLEIDRSLTENHRKGGYGFLSLYWMVSGLLTHYTLIPWLGISLAVLILTMAGVFQSTLSGSWLLLVCPFAGLNLLGEWTNRKRKNRNQSELKRLGLSKSAPVR